MALLPRRQMAIACLIPLAGRSWLLHSRQIVLVLLHDMAFLFVPADTGALSGGVIVSIVFGVLLFIGLLLGFLIFRRK